MGKRQIRVPNSQLAAKREALLDKEVQIVLQNRQVLQGRLTDFTEEWIKITDHRFNKHQVPLPEIEEIVMDFVAPY